MNSRHRTELDRNGNLLPKEVIIKLILNRSSEKLEPHALNLQKKQNIHIRLFGSREDVQELDFDEHLQLCVSQCYRLDKATKNKFIQSHLNLEINDDNRKPFIMLFSDAYYNKLTNPNYYEILVKEIKNYPQSYFVSIEKDVTRTFRRESQNCQKLTNILKAYAMRNPRLLYCQGLNYLAAYFLINNYSQQQTFWVVVQLIEQTLPVDYYVDMGAVISLSSILTDLAREVMPGFAEMCEELGVDTSFFLVPWLVCLYTKGFSSSLSNFIMENIVIEKEVALVKTALALLKVVVPRFSKCEDFGCFMKQLDLSVTSVSVKEFKLVYDSIYVNKYFFTVLLDNYMREYWQRAQFKQKGSLSNQKNNILPMCHQSFPVCLHYVEINRRLHGMAEVDTFRIRQPLDTLIEPSYLEQPRFSGNPSSINKQNIFKTRIQDLLIGRHKHICIENNVRRKLSQFEIQQIVREITDQSKKEEELEEQEFQERELRTTNIKKIEVISSIFEVVEDFKSDEFDVLEEFAENRKDSQVGKKDSNVKLPEQVPSNTVIGWLKKLF